MSTHSCHQTILFPEKVAHFIVASERQEVPLFSPPYRNPRTGLPVLNVRLVCFNPPHNSLLCTLELQAKDRDNRIEEGGL